MRQCVYTRKGEVKNFIVRLNIEELVSYAPNIRREKTEG